MGWARFFSVKWLLAIFWLSSTVFANIANAITLAPIAVRSNLGQNLVAEIDILNLGPQEELSLKVGIADPKAFFDLNMDYNQSIGDAQVELLRRPDGTRFIKLRSARPIAEPFVDLVIEVSSSAAKLIRPYRLLLDPPPPNDGALAGPELAQLSPVATTSPVGAASAADPTPLAAIAATNFTGTNANGRKFGNPAILPDDQNNLRVRPGDTAGKIANRLKPEGASTEQMLIALLQSNPQAFIRDNVNLMLSGAVITVPAPESVFQIKPQDARASLATQALAHNTLQRAGKKQMLSAKDGEHSDANENTTNSVTAKAPTAPRVDALKLSKNTKPDKKEVEKLEQLARERNKQRELDRAAELEKNVQELSALAKATSLPQPSAAASKPIDAAPSPSANAVTSPPVAQSTDKVDPISIAAPLTPASQVSAPQQPEAPKVPSKVASTPAPVPEESDFPDLVLEALADYWRIFLISMGVIFSGVGAFVWARKRKNVGKATPAVTAVSAEEKSEAPWTINTEVNNASYGGDQVDTNLSNSRLQAENSVFAAELDPVAEADVYLAYGKDEPAEEILREGLIQDPKRVAIHLKLAEIYAARQDTANFADCADQVEVISGKVSTDWAQIQSLGQSIEPGNPRYQNATAASVSANPKGGMLEFENSVFGGNFTAASPPANLASAEHTIDPVLSFAPGGDGGVPGKMVTSSGPKPFSLNALSLDLAQSPSPQTQSMSEQLETSMELAKQFIEIGEMQGARSMLDEVIANGSDEQREAAQAMMATLK